LVPLAPPALVLQKSEVDDASCEADDASALMQQSCAADDASSTLRRTSSFSGGSFVSSKAPWAKLPPTVTHQTNIQEESPWPSTPSTLPATPRKSDQEASDKESAGVSSSGKRRWADLVSDEDDDDDDDASPVCRTTGPTPVPSPAGEKKRWADLSEDESDPVSSLKEVEEDKSGAKDEETENIAAFQPLRRPQFSRPTRETRGRQLRAKVTECFELDFDKVDSSQQDGLTHRMLVTLKSLGESISFWTLDGEQVTQEAFHLFGLEEADMYAIGRVIRKADKLLEERRFRDAYNELRKASRWFDPETLEEERANARVHAERVAERKSGSIKDHKIQPDGASNEWSTVTQKKTKKIASEVPLKSEQSGRRNGSKKEEQVGGTGKPQKNEGQVRNAAKGQNRPHRSSAKSRNAPQKFLCRYIVGIEQNRSFNVVRKLLGDHGSHMKEIAESTGAKLRIRGRGSGFKEGPENVEANDPLMICISATSSKGFVDSTKDVESLLKHVHNQYCAFCEERNLPRPNLVVEQTEQPQLQASR